jgi:DMSO/TMAO reductase YedYZ molybdopterin-dependent catalytic subunit
VLAEGSDAAVMTRSVPIDKCLSDALIVFAQNGEAMRPEQGYPMRLFLPGWEGNISIKWLRRLEVKRQALLHARGDVEIYRPDHHHRQGAHLHLRWKPNR